MRQSPLAGAPVADLDLMIRRADGAQSYLASLRLEWANQRTDLVIDTPLSISFTGLRELVLQPAAYAAALTAMAFPSQLREAWMRVESLPGVAGAPLRLRLNLDPADDQIQALRWELLNDPLRGLPIAHSERYLLSRYLSGSDLGTPHLRPPGRLPLLAAIAAPTGAEQMLVPVDVAAESERITRAAAALQLTLLDGREGRPPATVDAIISALRDGAPLLYLVCHGTLHEGDPYLWLEHPGAPYRPVPASQLISRIAGLQRRPAAIILTACHGAGDDWAALTAVGPLLARAGVSAVVGMRGSIAQDMVARLIPPLLGAVAQRTPIDQALAIARAALPSDDAWWAPVLWMHTRDGQIWARPNPGPSHDVRNIPNPYLGLRAYESQDRLRYGGRTAPAQAALRRLTAPGAREPMLFITGASGCGKSSFVQAALIPALHDYQRSRSGGMRSAMIRPGGRPMAALLDALDQLGVNITHPAIRGLLEDQRRAAQGVVQLVRHLVRQGNAVTLFFDQFEELFSQAEGAEREASLRTITGLIGLAGEEPRLYLLATLRIDYLPALFAHPELYSAAARGIPLRAMSEEELKEAILRPFLDVTSGSDRAFDPELLAALASDAARDETYLPLLQVTLEDIWRRGALVRAAYGTLTDAISRRAEDIYHHRNVDGPQRTPRPPREQARLMDLLLGLIAARSDETGRRNVRRRRTLAELRATDADVDRLVDELATVRLVSRRTEQIGEAEQQVVDLIHETLIDNWGRLRAAVDARRELFERRERLERRLADWAEHQREDELLSGAALDEALALMRSGDVAASSPTVQSFIQQSLRRRQAAEQQRLEEERRRTEAERRRALAEQQRADAEARRAELEVRAAAQLRRRAVVLLIVTVIALIAAAGAMLGAYQASIQTAAANKSRAEAEQRSLEARAAALAARSQGALAEFPQRSLLLAVESVRLMERAGLPPLPSSREALDQALVRVGGNGYAGHQSPITAVAFSRDSKLVASGDGAEVRLWSLDGGRLIHRTTIPLRVQNDDIGQEVAAIEFSPDGRWLVVVQRGAGAFAPIARLYLIRADDGAMRELSSAIFDWQVTTQFSPDSRWLLVSGPSSQHVLWQLSTADLPAAPALLVPVQSREAAPAALSPGGRLLAIAITPTDLGIWDLQGSQMPEIPTRVAISARQLVFSPDDRLIAIATPDHSAVVWNLDQGWQRPIGEFSLPHAVEAMAFSPDGRRLAIFETSTGSSRRLSVWDIGTTTLQAETMLEGFGALDARFSPDPARLLVMNSSRVYLWDTTRVAGGLVEVSRSRGAFPPAMTISADGRWLATEAERQIALVGLGPDLQPVAPITLYGHDRQVRSLAASADGRWMLSGGDDMMVRLWDLTRVSALGTVPTATGLPEGGAQTLALSDDGQYALIETIGENRGALIVDVAGAEATQLLAGNAPMIAVSPSGRWVLTSDPADPSRAALWDTESLPQEQRPILLYAQRDDLTCTGQGLNHPSLRMYAVENRGGRFAWWRPPGSPALWIGDYDRANLNTFSPDDRWLAIGGPRKTTRIWNLQNPAAPPALNSLAGGAIELIFTPDSTALVALDSDGGISLWSSEQRFSGSPTRHLSGDIPFSRMRFIPTGALLTVGCESINLVAARWDLGDTKNEATRIYRDPSLYQSGAVVSSGGRWLAVGLWPGYPANANTPTTLRDSFRTIKIYDLLSPQESVAFVLSDDTPFTDITFSDDENWAVTLGEGGTVTRWPLTSERSLAERQQVVLPSLAPRDVAISRDDRHIVVAAGAPGFQRASSTVIAWPTDVSQLLDTACAVAGRNLSIDEWRQAFGSAPYQLTCTQAPLHHSVITEADATYDRTSGGALLLADLDRLAPQEADALRLRQEQQQLWESLIPLGATNLSAKTLSPLIEQLNALPDDRRALAVSRLGREFDRTGLPDIPLEEQLALLALMQEAQPFLSLPDVSAKLLASAGTMLAEGRPELAAALIDRATALGAKPELMPKQWLYLCRVGALRSSPNAILTFCDAGIRAGLFGAPILESRAIARARSGDLAGAYQDLERALAQRRITMVSEQATQQTRDWIAALEVGQNPFDADTLDMLMKALPQYGP